MFTARYGLDALSLQRINGKTCGGGVKWLNMNDNKCSVLPQFRYMQLSLCTTWKFGIFVLGAHTGRVGAQ